MVSKYSFIRFNEPDNGADLPVVSLSDITFIFPYSSGLLVIRLLNEQGGVIAQGYVDTSTTYQGYVRVDVGSVNASFSGKFRIQLAGSSGTHTSNLFNRCCEFEGTTSVIRYRCSEPAYGFTYDCHGYLYNQLRLPALLQTPQFPQQQSTYRDSKGVTRTLFSSVGREYTLNTDGMPPELHQRLAVALSHQEVAVNGVNVYLSGSYDLSYEKGTPYPFASCKVSENGLDRLCGCGTCGILTQTVTISIESAAPALVLVSFDGVNFTDKASAGYQTGAQCKIYYKKVDAYGIGRWESGGLLVTESSLHTFTVESSKPFKALVTHNQTSKYTNSVCQQVSVPLAISAAYVEPTCQAEEQ